MKSPSQWRGTARSCASAGRSLIMICGSTKPLPRPRGARTRHPQRPSRAQPGRELAAQRATALHVERLVDRLVRDPHRGIIREVEREPVGDLLGAPRLRPAPILAATVAAADPAHLGSGDARAVRGRDDPGEPLLHIPPQRLVRGQLGRLRSPRAPVSVPLRGRCPVLEPTAAGRGVAVQLARDRRRRTPKPPRDLPHPPREAARSAPSTRSSPRRPA